MSDLSWSDSEASDVASAAVDAIDPFALQPLIRKKEDQSTESVEEKEMEVVRPVAEWCTCGCCQDMGTVNESICCQDHDISIKIPEDEQCITRCHGVVELMAEAPLEVAWNSYLCYHDDKFPNGEPARNSKNRLCAYRNLVFWCWPDIRKKERRPLPACLVSMVRATFPPTDDEEQFADHQFTGFCYGIVEEDDTN